MENKYFNAPNQSNCSFLKESFWIWSYSYIIKLLAGFCSEKYPAQVPVVRNKNLKLKAHLQVAVVRACDFESSFACNVKYHTSAEIPCHITLQPKISILEPVLNCCFVVFFSPSEILFSTWLSILLKSFSSAIRFFGKDRSKIRFLWIVTVFGKKSCWKRFMGEILKRSSFLFSHELYIV